MSDEKSTKLDEMFGKAARDPEFRKKILANPEEALRAEGLSEEELAAVIGGMKPKNVKYCSDKTCFEHG